MEPPCTRPPSVPFQENLTAKLDWLPCTRSHDALNQNQSQTINQSNPRTSYFSFCDDDKADAEADADQNDIVNDDDEDDDLNDDDDDDDDNDDGGDGDDDDKCEQLSPKCSLVTCCRVADLCCSSKS